MNTYPYAVSFLSEREDEFGDLHAIEVTIHGAVTVTPDEFIPRIVDAYDDAEGKFIAHPRDLTWEENETAEVRLIDAARNEFGTTPELMAEISPGFLKN